MNRLIILAFCFFLTSCSVALSLAPSRLAPNNSIKVEMTEEQVVKIIGKPLEEHINEDKTKIAIYVFEQVGKGSTDRALGHFVLDVVTLSAWEIIGTPAELNLKKRRTYKQFITYNKDKFVIKTEIEEFNKKPKKVCTSKILCNKSF